MKVYTAHREKNGPECQNAAVTRKIAAENCFLCTSAAAEQKEKLLKKSETPILPNYWKSVQIKDFKFINTNETEKIRLKVFFENCRTGVENIQKLDLFSLVECFKLNCNVQWLHFLNSGLSTTCRIALTNP